MFLHDIHGTVPYRIGAKPSQMANRVWPSVHETTISSRQPGALISMHIPVANKTAAQIQRERVASTFSALWQHAQSTCLCWKPHQHLLSQ